MLSKRAKSIFKFILTELVIIALIISLYNAIINDRTVHVRYEKIVIEDENVMYYNVTNGKLVIVLNDGTTITEKLPTEIGIHSQFYIFYVIGIIALALIGTYYAVIKIEDLF